MLRRDRGTGDGGLLASANPALRFAFLPPSPREASLPPQPHGPAHCELALVLFVDLPSPGNADLIFPSQVFTVPAPPAADLG